MSPSDIHHCATVSSIITPPLTATLCTQLVGGAPASLGSPSDTRRSQLECRTLTDGRICSRCTMYVHGPATGSERAARLADAADASRVIVAHVAPSGGTTKRRSMCPGENGRKPSGYS